MAGEHVKDAKQATGVRATSQTYTNEKLSFFLLLFLKDLTHEGDERLLKKTELLQLL